MFVARMPRPSRLPPTETQTRTRESFAADRRNMPTTTSVLLLELRRPRRGFVLRDGDVASPESRN